MVLTQYWNFSVCPKQFQALGSSKSHGTAILLSKNVNFITEAQQLDPQGWFIFLKGSLNGFNTTFASIYAPNQAYIQFLDDTLSKLQSFQEGDFIIEGNLNFIVYRILDRSFHRWDSSRQSSHQTQLASLFNKYHIYNAWRHIHCGEKNYTYFSSHHQFHTWNDYILIS